MSDRPNTRNMALFCDFENVALGVRDAKYAAIATDEHALQDRKSVL